MPQPQLFSLGWRALQVLTVLLVMLFAWELERMWRYRASIIGVRRVICVMVTLAALVTLTILSFWGLFSL